VSVATDERHREAEGRRSSVGRGIQPSPKKSRRPRRQFDEDFKAQAVRAWIPWKTAKNAVSHRLDTHQLFLALPTQSPQAADSWASLFLGSYKHLAGVETQYRKLTCGSSFQTLAAVINSLDESTQCRK